MEDLPVSQEGHVACVVAFDAPRLLLEALGAAIEAEPDLRCVGMARTFEQAVMSVSEAQADVLLLQIPLPDAGVTECVEHARAVAPAVRVVAVSEQQDDRTIREAAASGANGFVLMDTPLSAVIGAMRSAVQGGIFVDRSMLAALLKGDAAQSGAPVRRHTPDLTPREKDVLALMGEGMDPNAIAKSLGVAISTCRGHVQRLLEKFSAHSQLEAVVKAAHMGLLPGLSGEDPLFPPEH